MVVEHEPAHRVRVLVAAPFSPSPSGRFFVVTQDSFAEELAGAGLTITARVPDLLGAGPTRELDASFTKLRSFSLAEVVKASPVLDGLRALADELGAPDASRRPDAEAVLSRIVAAVGEGKLSERVMRELAPPAPAPAPAARERAPVGGTRSKQEPDAIDAIFAQADVKPAASAGVDAFIKAVRDPGAKPAASSSPAAAKMARQAIEEAVVGTASAILRAPEVARVEAAWRGLKLLMDQCPAAASLAVEAVDVEGDAVVGAVEEALARDPNERPDVTFVAEPPSDIAVLERLAAAGEGGLAPVVAAVTPALLGARTFADLTAEQKPFQAPEAWVALRAEDPSRWLCATANPIVLAAEGVGAARRGTFGSPVFAVAAMLAASYRDTGAFGRVFGNSGAVRTPGTWEIKEGRDAGTAVPTESFVSINAQAKLAALGILALGSARNTDKIAISAAPTMRRSPDAVPLTAQILTGQLVRLAQWVRSQVPTGASEADIKQIFESAADVFLFPGLAEGARLVAKVTKGPEGRQVELAANVRPEIAGIPFEMAFALPI